MYLSFSLSLYISLSLSLSLALSLSIYIYTRDLGRFAPRSLALHFAPWCFRLVPHSHNITTYYSKCGHMYCFCLMPHRHDRAISTSEIIQSSSKCKHSFILYIPILVAIDQKHHDTRRGVADQYLIENLSNFYHIVFSYVSSSP